VRIPPELKDPPRLRGQPAATFKGKPAFFGFLFSAFGGPLLLPRLNNHVPMKCKNPASKTGFYFGGSESGRAYFKSSFEYSNMLAIMNLITSTGGCSAARRAGHSSPAEPGSPTFRGISLL
jgi:hypothetical protein